jgi:hypothetical protein
MPLCVVSAARRLYMYSYTLLRSANVNNLEILLICFSLLWQKKCGERDKRTGAHTLAAWGSLWQICGGKDVAPHTALKGSQFMRKNITAMTQWIRRDEEKCLE